MTAGLCPLTADSDGDTLRDGEETDIFWTEPDSSNSTITVTAELDGTNTFARYYWAENAEWYEEGSTLVGPEHWAVSVRPGTPLRP